MKRQEASRFSVGRVTLGSKNMFAKFLSSSYHSLQPLICHLPAKWQVSLASCGRNYFMRQFVGQKLTPVYIPPAQLARKLWGIEFRNALANSAGMFKNGEGYDVVAALGAGAYLGGTTTANQRLGNTKHGIALPFISLAQSRVAINCLGLPNYGDEKLSAQLLTAHKIKGCPIGWSLMRSPDFNQDEGLLKLINSLWLYHENLQIDFIEINESCPNIQHSSTNILPRLQLIAEQFLAKRRRHLPVIVKLSNDMGQQALELVVATLISLGFDGINLGNTSTSYAEFLPKIDPSEREMYTYFTSKFGGGVSGVVLKERSLELCAIAAERVALLKPNHEFHIIRSGGIDCQADLIRSQAHGVSFNQWYSGFFNNYAKFGNQIYGEFFAE